MVARGDGVHAFRSACPLPWARRSSPLRDRRVRFVPLNWPAGVAVTLWLFAGPPPPGTYARFALLLQGGVTGGVVVDFQRLWLAAYQNGGNVIELARTSVGVGEACSGVQSLISCTVAGLFLSALLVSRPWRRALVVVVSPAIGLAMKFSAIPPAYAACECRCQHRGPLA